MHSQLWAGLPSIWAFPSRDEFEISDCVTFLVCNSFFLSLLFARLTHALILTMSRQQPNVGRGQNSIIYCKPANREVGRFIYCYSVPTFSFSHASSTISCSNSVDNREADYAHFLRLFFLPPCDFGCIIEPHCLGFFSRIGAYIKTENKGVNGNF